MRGAIGARRNGSVQFGLLAGLLGGPLGGRLASPLAALGRGLPPRRYGYRAEPLTALHTAPVPGRFAPSFVSLPAPARSPAHSARLVTPPCPVAPHAAGNTASDPAASPIRTPASRT